MAFLLHWCTRLYSVLPLAVKPRMQCLIVLVRGVFSGLCYGASVILGLVRTANDFYVFSLVPSRRQPLAYVN